MYTLYSVTEQKESACKELALECHKILDLVEITVLERQECGRDLNKIKIKTPSTKISAPGPTFIFPVSIEN
jgi:hypothetical protein